MRPMATRLSAGAEPVRPPPSLPPLRLFGGKGGVGKTTCAAAFALAAAESGRRILIVSTDPAHSLGDALGEPLSPEPRPIRTRRGTLLAAELDAEAALERWRDRHREALRTLAERGTYLDEEDVDRLLGLSLPGADELFGLLELARLARERPEAAAYDEVVVDTAPTAHTLRLLAMPEALQRYAAALDRLQSRHRWMAESFGGGYHADKTDALVADLAAEGRGLGEALRDPRRSALVWITLPEALPVAEAQDAVTALEAEGIPVREVVVNRVTPPEASSCPVCHARRRAERGALKDLRKAFTGRDLRFLPTQVGEPRGLTVLRRVGKALASPTCGLDLLEEISEPASGRRNRARVSSSKSPPAWVDSIAPEGTRLLLFGGKGGVGKTTCAAATALTLARLRPAQRILLLSTDPAHSLGDVLEASLGDDARPLPEGPPGLLARELDAARAFARWRDRHGGDLSEALGSLSSSEGDTLAAGLLESPPPGLDELVAVSTLLDAVLGDGPGQEPGFDLVVVDTAPTGHALRLLEMPALALAWDHALLAVLLKYREVVGLGDLAAELVELSKSLKRLQALLADPARTRFVAVTRAAELPRRETERLLASLTELSIAVPAVVVNAVTQAAPDCRFCAAASALEEREVAALASACRGPAIIRAPAVYPPPRGVAKLAAWARTWKEASG